MYEMMDFFFVRFLGREDNVLLHIRSGLLNCCLLVVVSTSKRSKSRRTPLAMVLLIIRVVFQLEIYFMSSTMVDGCLDCKVSDFVPPLKVNSTRILLY